MKIKDPMCPAKTQRNQTNTKSKKRMTVDTITSLINSNNLQPSLVFLLYYLTFRKLKASLSNLQLMSHLFKIMYWFLAVLGLCCWEGFSLVAGSRGLLSSCRLPMQWLLLLRSTASRACRLHQLQHVGSRGGAQWLWCKGLVAPRHVESFPAGDRTQVPCIGRQILNRSATREAPAIASPCFTLPSVSTVSCTNCCSMMLAVLQRI